MVFAFDRSKERFIPTSEKSIVDSESSFVIGKVYQERHHSSDTFQDSYGIMRVVPTSHTPFQFIGIEGDKIIGRNVKTGQHYEAHLTDKGFRLYSDGLWNAVNCIIEIGDTVEGVRKGWLNFDPKLVKKTA